MKTELDEKVRDEIITAATTVFETYGFAKVTMQDISKACGKGRSTLYYYFGNKTEVFDALTEKICEGIFDRCEAQLSKKASLATNIENFHKQKLKETKFLTQKYHLVLEDLKQDPSVMLTKFRFKMEEEIALINDAINWSIEKKEIAFLDADDSRFLAETMVAAFKSFEQEILLFNRFPKLETKLAWLSLIFCKGLK